LKKKKTTRELIKYFKHMDKNLKRMKQ